jgi:hypothetical protein
LVNEEECSGGVRGQHVDWLQISLNELLALRSATMCGAVNFLFGERRLHLPAAVGAAFDSGPHTPGGDDRSRPDAAALSPQEQAKPGVLIRFSLGQFAYLNKINGHACPRYLIWFLAAWFQRAL